jgi:7-cyano-7-deazaguanine synthase in queuosine biosynthesis
MIDIKIPQYTPLGNKVNSIGIWMSGGADSSLLCYLLAEKIKRENLQIKILPMTVDYKRPFKFIAGTVRKKIEELLDAESIFFEHEIYKPTENLVWSWEDLQKQFPLHNEENIRNKKFQILYSGITTNPPQEIQKNFAWGILPDVEKVRGIEIEKSIERYFTVDENQQIYEFYQIKPFFNINKQKIYEIYKIKNLLDNLFPLTRSCEDTTTSEGHCGKCWWCEERQWAFGRI